MGWLVHYLPYGRSVTDEILSSYTWSNESGTREVIAHSVQVARKVAYMAVKHTPADGGEPVVWAGVALFSFNPKTREFGIKDMDETVGPCECECPARILDLLTPTEYDYANQWRANCRAVLEQKATNAKKLKALREGARLTFEKPLRFSNGKEVSGFTVGAFKRTSRGRTTTVWTFRGDDGQHYSLNRRVLAQASIA